MSYQSIYGVLFDIGSLLGPREKKGNGKGGGGKGRMLSTFFFFFGKAPVFFAFRQEEEATAPALGRLSDEACEGDVAAQRVLRHRRAWQARGGRVLRHWGTV